MSTELKTLVDEYGQSHLLEFWNELSDGEKKALETDILSSNIPEAIGNFTRAMSTLKEQSKLQDDKIKPVPTHLIEAYEKSTTEKLTEYEEIGLKEIRDGKVAVLLMAGGQGTRLGVDYPKGMYDVGLPSGRSLFHLQALRIRRLQNIVEEKYGKSCRITWYIMTSDATHDSTLTYFKKNDYFGLRDEDIVAFKQGTLPCFTFDGKIILDEKHKLSRAPNGNGGLYEALYAEGIIEDMQKRGIRSIHSFSVDNILVRVADPVFIGYCLSRNADFALKVVTKRAPDEPLGVASEVDGKYKIVEYSEISNEKASLRDKNGELVFNSGNICNHYFTLEFLLNLTVNVGQRMDLHVAKKKIPYIDQTGIKHKPSTPNGIKIEKFVFDVLKFAKNFVIWQILREKEFSALKNADSAKEDCPSTAKNDVLKLHKNWLLRAGAEAVNGEVEICPLTSYAGENLEKFVIGQSLTGPICLSYE